jgi:hypothetical protein
MANPKADVKKDSAFKDGLSKILERISNIWGTISNMVAAQSKISIYGGAILVGVLVLIMFAIFWPDSAPVSVEVQVEPITSLQNIEFKVDDIVLPPLPAQMHLGEYSPPFLSKPHWDLGDVARYLPPLSELLLLNLREANRGEFSRLLERIPDLRP